MNTQLQNARMARNKYALETFDSGAKVTKIMCEALNGGSITDFVEGMLAQMQVEHRYLQSESVMAMLKFIAIYAQIEHFDLRNQWAVDKCKAIVDKLPSAVKVNWEPTLDQREAFYENQSNLQKDRE